MFFRMVKETVWLRMEDRPVSHARRHMHTAAVTAMTAYTNALFEVVVHDFTKEESLHYLDTMHQFFIPGWRAILGL